MEEEFQIIQFGMKNALSLIHSYMLNMPELVITIIQGCKALWLDLQPR